METKKGLTQKQFGIIMSIVFLIVGMWSYWDYKVMEADKVDNARQIQLMNLKGATHYYWTYEPGAYRASQFYAINDEPLPVNNTFSVYAKPGDWIRVHYLHEVTLDHYLELEVEVVVIR